MKKLILFGMLFLWWTCDTPTTPDALQNPEIVDTYLDYNVTQNSSQLFIQVEVNDAQGLDNVETVEVGLKFIGNDYILFDSTFTLNDDSNFGDILPNNGVFSLLSDTEMIYGKYRMISFAMDSDGNSTTVTKYIEIEEKIPPEIISIEMPEVFILDPTEWTNLDISVTILESNGADDIKNVLYSINTDFMYSNVSSNSECEFELYDNPSEENYYHDISWVLEYSESIGDSLFVYSTSIPMRPISECGGYGIALFKFTVRDSDNNSDEDVFDLEIIKCGDDICQNEYEDSDTCPEDCQ
ncbi:MAG: hypothetical protein ISR90_05895 [Candidatus Marinimicrobia bacterium]|nr:hypothetical protein [Candidatus Neomarinimicrobiota bacterium]MBL7023565.1 hypothetical protein [Candidatus Neomarinimicrobiota bacterium]MBL7109854.1 hypothetical protein [Candidatus Neomarinimicrobiota bacterium]